jgi:hypothetical protein
MLISIDIAPWLAVTLTAAACFVTWLLTHQHSA